MREPQNRRWEVVQQIGPQPDGATPALAAGGPYAEMLAVRELGGRILEQRSNWCSERFKDMFLRSKESMRVFIFHILHFIKM